MSEKASGRKRRGWIWITIALVAIVALVAWLYGPRIMGALRGEATPPPSAVSDSTGMLYATQFDSAEDFGQWELFDDSVITAKAGDGALITSVNSPSDTGTWSGLALTFSDFALITEVRKLAGSDENAALVIFSMVDSQNYDQFAVSSDGYYMVSAVRNGVSMIISDWNHHPAIATGTGLNQIGITRKDGAASFSVNGETLPLCIATDAGAQALWDPANPSGCIGGSVVNAWQTSDLPEGRIGLGTQGYTGFDGENTTLASASYAFESLLITLP